jgi:hypothetical protein
MRKEASDFRKGFAKKDAITLPIPFFSGVSYSPGL